MKAWISRHTCLQIPSLMLLLATLDSLTQMYASRCTPKGVSMLSMCRMAAAVFEGLCTEG